MKIINEQDRKILKGFNSDEIGFRQSLQPLLKDSHRKALILGTGGASKAVFYSLEKLGIEPLYVSRHFAPGQITYEQLTPEIMQQYTVVVNTTPLGMYPNIETKPEIPYQYITDKHLCYDLVYNPQVTAFMNSCSQNGAIVKNGYEMLVLQALAAWKIWND